MEASKGFSIEMGELIKVTVGPAPIVLYNSYWRAYASAVPGAKSRMEATALRSFGEGLILSRCIAESTALSANRRFT